MDSLENDMIGKFSIREILEAFLEAGRWSSFPGSSRAIREESHVCGMRSLTTNCRLRGVRSDSAPPTPILNHFNFVGEIRAIRDVVQNDPAPSGVESTPPPPPPHSFSNPRSATDRNKPQTPAFKKFTHITDTLLI